MMEVFGLEWRENHLLNAYLDQVDSGFCGCLRASAERSPRCWSVLAQVHSNCILAHSYALLQNPIVSLAALLGYPSVCFVVQA